MRKSLACRVILACPMGLAYLEGLAWSVVRLAVSDGSTLTMRPSVVPCYHHAVQLPCVTLDRSETTVAMTSAHFARVSLCSDSFSFTSFLVSSWNLLNSSLRRHSYARGLSRTCCLETLVSALHRATCRSVLLVHGAAESPDLIHPRRILITALVQSS